MWQSMRIMKRFSMPDILRTVPGATKTNAVKFIGRLLAAGYIGRIGSYVSGRAGEFKSYALLKDTGPVMPSLGLGKGNDNPKNETMEESI
jgi:hypothetical protein